MTALQERFLADSAAFRAFQDGFAEELGRLRRGHRAERDAAPRELDGLNRRSKAILEALAEGYRDAAWKVELAQLERRSAELESVIAGKSAEPRLPTLPVDLADTYRRTVRPVAAVLANEDEGLREAARSNLRGFVDRILIPARGGALQVRGDLKQMLTAATGEPKGSILAAVVENGCGGGI